MDFNQENFDKGKLPENLDNGLIYFQKSENLKSDFNKSSFNKSDYTSKKSELPDGFNLLDATGVEFVKYKQHVNKFFLPYSITLLGKLERFINLGHFPFYFDHQGMELKLKERKPTLPHERVRFFSSRVGDYGTVPWKYNHDTDFVLINIDYPKKAETFVLANIERYAFKSEEETCNGCRVLKRGFSTAEYNKEGKLIKAQNMELYQGIVALLAQEIVVSVTRKKTEYIDNRDYGRYNIKEYIKIAKFIRDFVNGNKNEDIKYDLKNDALIYDLLVNKDLTETKSVINSKCLGDTFGVMMDMIEGLKNQNNISEFRKQYINILKLFRWMKKTAKNS